MSVPLLPISAICDFLNQVFMLQLTDGNLKKPTSQMVLSVLECFLKELGFDLDTFNQVRFNQLLEGLELGETSITASYSMNVMNYIMEQAQFPDFGYNDIMQPDGKRTRRIFCHLINFWRYYVAKEDKIISKNFKKYEFLSTMKQQKDQEIDLCKQELNQMMKKRSQLETQLQAVEESHGERLAQIEDVKQQAALLTKEKQEGRLKIAEVNEKIADLKLDFTQLESKWHDVQSQLVKSPDRLSAELKAPESQCAEIEKNNNALSAKTTEIVKDSAQLEELQDLADTVDQHLCLFSQDMEQFKKKSVEIRQMENLLSSKITEFNELETRKQEEQSGLHSELQIHIGDVRGLENRFRQFQDTLIQVEQDLAEFENRRHSEEAQQQELKNYLTNLRVEIAEEEQRHKDTSAAMKNARKTFFTKLAEVEDHYIQEFDSMDKAVDNVKFKIEALTKTMKPS